MQNRRRNAKIESLSICFQPSSDAMPPVVCVGCGTNVVSISISGWPNFKSEPETDAVSAGDWKFNQAGRGGCSAAEMCRAAAFLAKNSAVKIAKMLEIMF